MRISDWSSDVCSSDLIAIAGKGRDALAVLERTTMALRGKGTNAVGAAAVDYLRLFALVAYGWLWVRMATAAACDTPQHTANRPAPDCCVEPMRPQAQAPAAGLTAGAEKTRPLHAHPFSAEDDEQ